MKQLIRYFSLLIILSTFIAIAVPANAGGYVYSGTRKKINCGVLVVDGAMQPLNSGWAAATPGVGDLFFLLDRSIELKPTGWSLENPLAPGSTSSGLLKNNPEYWKIYLSSAGDLSMMHVLYLPASGSVTLSEADKEKLREFVDGGGVLWIDNTGTSPLDFQDSFFITKFLFDRVVGSSDYDIPWVRHHPLLTIPNWLSDQDVAMLGSAWGQYYCKPGYVPSPGGWDSVSEQPINFDILLPVVAKRKNTTPTIPFEPSVAANAYGSGRIVATANYVGKGCYFTYPYNLPNVKFAFNVVAWVSSWTHLRKNPRHNGYSIDTVGGTKLSESWSAGVSATANVESAPVIYKNIVFYSSGNALYAFDLMPLEDLDHDGNPDDGIQGPTPVAGDKGRDLIWKWSEQSGGGTLSSPTIVTVQSPSNPGASVDVVLVMSSSGEVYMLEAFPTKAPPTGGYVPPTLDDVTNVIDHFPADRCEKPSPPIYDNGWIYATDGTGHLHAYNPGLKAWADEHNKPDTNFHWTVPSKTAGFSDVTADLRSGPCFGFVKNANSGATVGMVYWFVSRETTTASGSTVGTTSNEQNDHVLGIPVRVSNDRLRVRQVSVTGDCLTEYQTGYPDGFILENPKPVVKFLPPISGAEVIYVNRDINGTPSSRASIVVKTSVPIPTTTTAYATYALDYKTTQLGINYNISPRVRQPLEPRSNSTTNVVPPTKIAGTPALGPDNMMFLNGTREASVPGSVYGIFNDGSNQITKWHSLLHSGTQVPSTSGSSVTNIAPVVKYKDSAGSWYSLSNIQAATSPVVAGNKVFVTVTSSDGKGALLCYKSNPDFVIRITETVGYTQGGKPLKRPKKLINTTSHVPMRVKLWQPNLLDTSATSSSVIVQPLTAGVSVPAEMIDYERGTITFDNFDRLKLRGNGPTGIMQTGIFSTSLPVWVFLDNLEVPIDYSTWGPGINMEGLAATTSTSDSVDLSGWNNLLWYYVVPNSAISSSPVVIGNLVYFMADNGTMYALNTETGESTGTQTAQTPVWQQSFSNATGSVNVSVAGSNGVLVVPTANALHAFNNPATLVADNSRILELDGAGEIRWSLDSVSWPVTIPSSRTSTSELVTKSGPISNPARVRYTQNGDIILVNTGANQVCKIDKGGFIGIENINGNYIRWMYDKFSDPRHILRPGQPLQLLNPTDALLWQEVENGVLVYHCLVADSGNYRIIDLVYRIQNNGVLSLDKDPASGYCLPEVNWVSNTDSTNGRYIYNSIQLIPTTRKTTVNGSNVDVICNDVWAAMSNYRTDTEMSNYQSGTDLIGSQGLGGAIVALGYRQRASFDKSWNYAVSKYSGQIVARCDRAKWGSTEKPVASPRFFQVTEKSDASHPQGRYLLICDNYGVYEVGPLGGAGAPSVVDALTDVDYRMKPRELIERETGNVHLDSSVTPPVQQLVPIGAPLLATSVQELPINGHWLISNGYSGTDSMNMANMDIPDLHPNKFSGEVFEYDPLNKKIVWSSPTLYISLVTVDVDPNTGNPIMGYDPGIREQALKNSYVLQQPRSALRLN